MPTAAIIISIVLVGLCAFKLLSLWIYQLKDVMLSNVPSAGLPLPLIGHSYLLLTTSPQDILVTLCDLLKYDKLQRKVCLCSYAMLNVQNVSSTNIVQITLNFVTTFPVFVLLWAVSTNMVVSPRITGNIF